ncbi:DUF7802 domain-containing protein [Gordonia rubripertincta]|uniref:DUF7802 domain-containing protein n=1 Tax=Gordonia rubripertincta TaxID=36822 RepID=A0ABT4MXU5_GORRU|nr:hypothetical protein [Gordonia rubripertincta]MCZ4551041.1 hypothetical protein [Gordonia rubripertincta]
MTTGGRFLDLAAHLGGISQSALDHFFYWRNPFTLENWTLNVIELLMVAVALAGLLHAAQIRRRTGDGSYLLVWLAAVVYCLAMEVPIYFFMSALGYTDDTVIFIHNEFTTGAFYGRMPLYVAALYPALLYPSYVLVRQTSIFDGRWGTARGAVCVGVVHHCFYEVFDHLGPQMKWWLWDYQLPTIGDITVASVPVFSQVNFSMLNPIAFAFVAHMLLRGRRAPGTDSLGVRRLVTTGRVLVAGILTPVLGVMLSLNLIYSHATDRPSDALIEMLSYGLAATAILFTLWQFARTSPNDIIRNSEPWIGDYFIPIFATVYLSVLGILWIIALPDYVSARDGLTDAGTPTGSLAYAGASAAACIWFVLRAHDRGMTRPHRPSIPRPQQTTR